MKKDSFFVTAIGTDSGKTVVSAVLCQALNYDYWKPVQCGFPTDSNKVKSLVDQEGSFNVYPERFLLETPASPHIAAANEHISISLNDFSLPSDDPMIVEGAGGIMVPINVNDLVIDIASRFDLPVILVSNLYLGSINHTLLSIEYLQKHKYTIAGIIFNGEDPQNTKEIILKRSGLKELLHLENESVIDQENIRKYAQQFRNQNPGLINAG